MSQRTDSVRLPVGISRRVFCACLLLLVGCIAGFPEGPPDPGVLPERITVLSVDAQVVDGDSPDPDVLLTFRVRNDAEKTAHRVSVAVRAFQGTTQVGQAMSHDNPRVAVGGEAAIGVRLEHPASLEGLDCYEYTVEALIDGHVGITAPVRKCLR